MFTQRFEQLIKTRMYWEKSIYFGDKFYINVNKCYLLSVTKNIIHVCLNLVFDK